MTTATPPTEPRVATPSEWRTARLALLEREKQFTKLKDELARQRRQLPWTKVEKDYRFQSGEGPINLADAFAGSSQLIVYHLMFGPDWEQACKSCSFVADHFDGALPHLKAKDTAFACVSRGPIKRLLSFRERMGWKFPWYSSEGTSFNFDFGVSFDPANPKVQQAEYNYAPAPADAEEMPGFSVFAKDAQGQLYHTYSTYGRGVEIAMTTYDLLDLSPKGRDEDNLEFTMEWVRHHDRYDA